MKIYKIDKGNSGYDPNITDLDFTEKLGEFCNKQFSYFKNIIKGNKYTPNRFDLFLHYSGKKVLMNGKMINFIILKII